MYSVRQTIPERTVEPEALDHGSGDGPRGAVGIIGSAGAIGALGELLGALPSDFPFPIVIAQHLTPNRPTLLAEILARQTRLPVMWAKSGEQFKGGTVYLVPPGFAMTIVRGRILLRRLPASALSWFESADRLLCSLSSEYGKGAIGIVLSGILPAGERGFRAIRSRGGITMAQNQLTSTFFDMPRSVIDWAKADIVCAPRRMAEALIAACDQWLVPGGGIKCVPSAQCLSRPTAFDSSR